MISDVKRVRDHAELVVQVERGHNQDLAKATLRLLKRLEKAEEAATAPPPNRIRVEAALSQGADYLYVDDVGGGRVSVDVGHSCVFFMRRVVPVEFLTAAVVAALRPFDCFQEPPQRFLEEFFRGYKPDYVKKLVDAVGPRR